MKYFLILFPLFFIRIGYSQSYHQQSRQIFAYNILSNGLIGGIGGVINKKKEEKIFPVFGRNFIKGALGGLVKFGAKWEVYALRKPNNYWIAHLDRAFYYVGYSFVYNATLNRSLLNSYHCQIYGVNLDIYIKDKFKVVPRVSVFTVSSLCLYGLYEKSKLDIKNSLKYGVYYFDENPKYANIRGGSALNNSISLYNYSSNPSSIPGFIEGYNLHARVHEISHTFQFPDYFPITNYSEPLLKRVKTNRLSIYLTKFIYWDIPYMSILYKFQPKPSHYKNYFEFEAEHFATREYISR